MKMKVKMRQVFGILLSIMLVLGVVPTGAMVVMAGGVSYIDDNGERQVVSEYTEVTSSTRDWSSGWYVVKGEVTLSQSIHPSGNVHLLLCDGAKLTVTVPGGRNSGVMVNSNQNDSLTIYGQENGTGELNLTNQNGFGFYYQNNNNQVTINGGKITLCSTATGFFCSNVIINSGELNVTSDNGYAFRGNVEINGGKVTAVSSYVQAIGGSVKNTITGKGWTNTEGTEGEAVIPINSEGQSLSGYKKVYFKGKTAPTVIQLPKAKELTYNGSPQDLVTAGEVTGGEMQYALGTVTEATQPYTTSIPTATDAGTYYVWYKVLGDSEHLDSQPGCVKVTIRKAESSDNTSDSGSTDTTDTSSKVPYEDVPIASGYVKDITGTAAATAESNPFETKIENNSKLKTLLSLTDAEVAEGVNVWLDIQDIGSSVSKTDKSLVQNASDDYTVGMYLDINLFKKVGSNAATKITETNGKIKASILIPESLRKSGRTLALIRVHDGVAKVIAGTYDEDTHIFTFETDKFSTYAIAYKDAASSTDSESTDSSSSTGSTSTGSTSTGSATTTATAPKTGEAADMRFWCLLVLSAFSGVGFFEFFRRKRVNK